MEIFGHIEILEIFQTFLCRLVALVELLMKNIKYLCIKGVVEPGDFDNTKSKSYS